MGHVYWMRVRRISVSEYMGGVVVGQESQEPNYISSDRTRSIRHKYANTREVSWENERDRSVQHRIRLARLYLIERTEVTRRLWNELMDPQAPVLHSDASPVTDIESEEVLEFIQNLSTRDGIGYRLPAETECAYAAQAGTADRLGYGDTFCPV